MRTRHKLIRLAIVAALTAASTNVMAVPVLMDDMEFVEATGTTTVEINGQVVEGDVPRHQSDEARRRAEDARRRIDASRQRAEQARAHADRIREEVRIALPDLPALGEAMSTSFAYSFTSGNVKSIKNAPYAGEVINERIQTLADGNQLVKRSSNRVYRDSQGATRQEVFDTNGQLKAVHIRDQEGTRYMLTPSKKSALKIGSPKHLADGKTATWVSKDGKEVDKRVIVASPKTEVVVNTSENVVVKRIDKDGKEKREEVRVRVGPGNFDFSGLAELGKLEELSVLGDAFAVAGDAFASAWRHGEPTWIRADKSYERTTTSLGTKSFDGVIAEGKMVSYTIPAGKVGNVKPITVSSESWYSPDLQITVYSKHSDPRSGDTIYRVANLKRSEQPQDLFRVPADYEVKDPMAKLAGTIKIEKTDKK